MDVQEATKKIEEEYGSRIAFMGQQIVTLSMTEQPCDVTFFKKKPAIDVKIDQKIALALMYGAGAKKLQELLSSIKLSNGDSVNITEIWTINPMPKNGLTQEQLDSVNIQDAESEIGPNNETLRKMVSDTYHCESDEQEDKYIRRYLAS